MITYQVEKWQDCNSEMAYLWPKHWKQVAMNQDKVPLDPDYEQYQKLQNDGALHVVTCRHDGKLVGYHITIVRTHLHYKGTLFGMTDVYFIDNEYRNGWTGIRLFREVERSLKKRGVKVLTTGTKLSIDMSSIFRYLRWVNSENLFIKYIGD